MAPHNQAAWLEEIQKPLRVKEAPYNHPGPKEIVIKNMAVAINPADVQQRDPGVLVPNYPHIAGCDVAGLVEEVGSEVKSFKRGDRVIRHVAEIPSHFTG